MLSIGLYLFLLFSFLTDSILLSELCLTFELFGMYPYVNVSAWNIIRLFFIFASRYSLHHRILNVWFTFLVVRTSLSVYFAVILC